MSSIEGELVTETWVDGGRQAPVCMTPSPPEAVVLAGDGKLISQWGATLERPTCRPRWSSASAGFTIRCSGSTGSHRASTRTGTPPTRGSSSTTSAMGAVAPRRRVAHRTYRGVRRLGRRRAGAGHRVSAPDVPGVIFSAPPGEGDKPPAALPNSLPRAYLVAGPLEPFFLANGAG